MNGYNRGPMVTIPLRTARRLALLRAGLLRPDLIALPMRAAGTGRRARRAAHRVIDHFGYLQLDTVSVAGARSHALVLLSRLPGLAPELCEQLLEPGEPLFEYWGHEASWIPLALYPAFEFRRTEFRVHPWYGDVLGEHPELARELLARIRAEGPLRAVDMDGRGRGWWQMQPVKKVALALWSCGELAISERRNFQRSYDLAERVIPDQLRRAPLPRHEAYRLLLERAAAGHGWATTGTLAATWRLQRSDRHVKRALAELVEEGRLLPCTVHAEGERRVQGWIRPADLELTTKLDGMRPRADRGVLLSPFDPVLWDRERVRALFGFEQVLEIYKPAAQRIFGYYCLPVLAGEKLVARVDLKAERQAGRLLLKALHFEQTTSSSRDRSAVDSALARLAAALALELVR